MNAPIAVPVPLKASCTARPSSGAGVPCAKRASGVGTGEKVLVSCFICAITSFMAHGRRFRGTTSSRLAGAEKIGLAELDAVVAQDVVGGGDVEIEIRPGEAEQVGHALEGGILAAQLDDDLLVLAAVD